MIGADGIAVAGLSTPILAYLLAAAFATAVFHTVGGFAGGVLLALAIAPAIEVRLIVPLLSICLVIGAISRMAVFRRELDVRTYGLIMAPALPGIVAGSLLYTRLSEDAVSIVLGVFLLATVALQRTLASRGIAVPRSGLAAAGAVFGLLSGLTIGAGILLAPFLIGRGILRERLAAVFAAVALAMNFTKSTVFLSAGTLPADLAVVGIAMGVCTIPGTLLGRAILYRTPVRVHSAFVEGLVLAAAVLFLWNGLS